MLLKIGFI